MYMCSNSYTLYILYIVKYTLHYIIAYMVTLSSLHVHYIVLLRCEGGMGRDPSPLEGGLL